MQLWEARRMIEAGEIGEVININLYELIMQGGCQGLSVAHMFAGDADVDWVVGWTNGDPFGEGDDDYKGIGGYLRYANGIECFVHARTGAARGLIVTGTEGVYVTDKMNHRFYRKVESPGPHLLSGLEHDTTVGPGTRHLEDLQAVPRPRRGRVRRGRLALPGRQAPGRHAVDSGLHRTGYRAQGSRSRPPQVL